MIKGVRLQHCHIQFSVLIAMHLVHMKKRRAEQANNPGKRRSPGSAKKEKRLLNNSSVNEGKPAEDVEDIYARRQDGTGADLLHEGLPIKMGKKLHRVSRIMAQKETDNSDEPSNPQNLHVQEEAEGRHCSPQQKLLSLKENIARLATQLQEQPDENTHSLNELCRYACSEVEAECVLAIAALVPVFKSLAPSYKIRTLSESEKREKVSREVAKQREFEEGFVRYYRKFIDRLQTLSVESLKPTLSSLLLTTSITAACELCMSSLRYFNFNEDLFSILIRCLGRKPRDNGANSQFTHCIRTIEALLKEDGEQGEISLKITRILSTKIKKVSYRVDESVFNVFLCLSILNNADPFINNSNQRKTEGYSKKKRIHLSKKERKARKEAKAIDEEMLRAEQAVSAKDRVQYQAQILQCLFKLYLETLRDSLLKSSDAHHLVAAVLEGLSRFGPMANIDLVGDFLEVLKELMDRIIWDQEIGSTLKFPAKGIYSAEDIRQILLCVATSFALISNHTEHGKLPFPVDLSRFVEGLYAVITDIGLDADLELSSRSLRLEDPLGEELGEEKPAVNVSTRSELLVKCLDFIFFRSKSGSKTRVMLFLKRLFMMSLHTPEKTTNANFKFISKLLHRYGEFVNTLWSTEDKVEDTVHKLGFEHDLIDCNMKTSNAHSAILWENILYESHYCQTHRDLSRSLAKFSK